MIEVSVYHPQHRQAWDQFILHSKNGTFLFNRAYMEYHSNRFTDHSLLFFKDQSLLAVMPASINNNTLVSHGGLTFGGIITDNRMKTPLMLEIFEALKLHLKSHGIAKLIYKAIPHIYHTAPAEEDQYALVFHGGQLIQRDVSSAIDMREKIAFSKGRKWAIKQAQKKGLLVKQCSDFKTFMMIEEHVLSGRHGIKPVHTAEEMELLAARFPDNIQLFAACQAGEMLAGVIIYESRNVAHAQYIAANDQGKKAGALDMILDFLINERYAGKRYFDFGISTEKNGRYLNEGLIQNKEGFGARAIVYDFYELKPE